jgi:hypothetical protein
VYAFATDSADEHVADWQPLSPPDGPLVLKPGETQRVWRLVRAPTVPGKYNFKVKFNNDKAVEASGTYNITEVDPVLCTTKRFVSIKGL